MQLGFSNSICLQFQNSVIYFVYFLNYKIIVETDMRRLVLATLASLDSFDFKEKKYSNSICILYCVLKSIFIYFWYLRYCGQLTKEYSLCTDRKFFLWKDF